MKDTLRKMQKDKERKRNERKNETDEQRELRKLKDKLNTRKRRQNELESDKEKRRKLDKEKTTKYRANETIEQIANRRKTEKERIRKRRSVKSKSNSEIFKKRCRKEEQTKQTDLWPRIIPEATKLKLLDSFNQKMAHINIEQNICCICNCLDFSSNMHITSLEKIPNFELLKLQENIQTDNCETDNEINLDLSMECKINETLQNGK